ncbi:hypothetical protein COW36_07150 [bacterium (Candidatus Blackallbacteria) CG17_big_fil_post_rev_8_21_14_2_50_48_46]|uniref:Uncharacterized protein n=1 Tax=bacterium (Candidatus Blackallbacteria) CG17_big_fil_post_rev_8_21_14_2_50_48_46 TaxID=2014261 RepID=A0A2M7G710_9BACT|nr:MAG: hypothetical protein COW64_06660 [bacterium (Candidatus Blackallbacteria) CG18_big_fil_WC_8_21_14_2_50_49_26]PIW17838.1 MAG: hypothetical protein COW36_07150 [bacterium (Candidatus Blackallbacteria) CG17_big_fil_post_rev_8_21_14_2_50_48_46]PIW48514.1 MAG: hypothetical protein COW20_09105 [bacterium (Candidatus Blackallbacteria) CG13_big_fil_rev_8_21_14_2_50_49_14]
MPFNDSSKNFYLKDLAGVVQGGKRKAAFPNTWVIFVYGKFQQVWMALSPMFVFLCRNVIEHLIEIFEKMNE